MAGQRVLRTRDDGASWQTAFPAASAPGSSNDIGAVWFLGPEDAWVEQIRVTGSAPLGTRISRPTILWRTTDGGAHWSRSRNAPHTVLSSTEIPFDRVSFSSPRSGFFLTTTLCCGFGAVSRAESLWATRDGGRTWTRVSAHGLPGTGGLWPDQRDQVVSDPYELVAASSNVAWLARTHGSPGLWRTLNGGRSWSRIGVPDAGGGTLVGAPSFWGSHGVVGIAKPTGRLVVDVSADGGSHWRVASTLATGSLTAAPGVDAVSRTIWIAPAPAGLFETTDAGRRWSLHRAGISLDGLDLDDTPQFAFASPASGLVIPWSLSVPAALFTANAGRDWSPSPFPALRGSKPGSPRAAVVAAPSLISDGQTLYRKSSDARRWRPVLHSLTQLGAMSFANPSDGWALAQLQLFMTTDRGATWSTRTEPAQGALTQAQLITHELGVGVACGASRTEALKTSNAGRSWQPLTLPSGQGQLLCDQDESSLCFTTAAHGWALVSDGAQHTLSLLRTTDGGHQWTRTLLTTRAGEGASIGCRGSTVWESAAGELDGMWGMPAAVFVSSDSGRHWLDAIMTGPRPPVAVGVRPTRTQANGDILTVVEIPAQTLVLLSGCVPCQSREHPDGTLGLEVSTDGGRRWSEPATAGTRSLPYLGSDDGAGAIVFTSPADGAILAESATNSQQLNLIRTNGHGRTWQRIASFPP